MPDANAEVLEEVSTSQLPPTTTAAAAARNEATTNENPDAARRVEQGARTLDEEESFKFEAYASARVHAINALNSSLNSHSLKLGDGASRVGVKGGLPITEGWYVFGRAEAGFDILDTFTSKAQTDSGGKIIPRLYNVGIESDWLYAKYGKSWSAYYTVAGAADRFMIFGGDGVGIYNADSDGGATGTGRADNALQTLFYADPKGLLGIKPFNINLQLQRGETIPTLRNARYGTTVSTSAWLESDNNLGVGLAYHHAPVKDKADPEVVGAGIDGDARAASIALKTYGPGWLVSAVIARMDNIETTDRGQYVNGEGAELFAQFQVFDNWWLIGGGNWMQPDQDDPQAGDYRVRYGVLGGRYTFDSFNRMLYLEWRYDKSLRFDGTPRRNEFTLGIRWDFNS